MTVLDASVLIGHLDGNDPHHARAASLLKATGGQAALSRCCQGGPRANLDRDLTEHPTGARRGDMHRLHRGALKCRNVCAIAPPPAA